MRSFRFLPFFLSLVAIASIPIAAIGQNQRPPPRNPNTITEDDRERLRYERQWRDRRRFEEEQLHEHPGCPGCNRRTEGIQSRPIGGTSLVAILNDVDLDDGVLTVRLRIYNDGSWPTRLTIDPEATYGLIFVRAGNEKLFILRNDHGDLVAKDRLDVELIPGGMESFWMDFPAPPEGTETFDIEISPIAPFEDLSLDDI